jgi:hypothetical protein
LSGPAMLSTLALPCRMEQSCACLACGKTDTEPSGSQATRRSKCSQSCHHQPCKRRCRSRDVLTHVLCERGTVNAAFISADGRASGHGLSQLNAFWSCPSFASGIGSGAGKQGHKECVHRQATMNVDDTLSSAVQRYGPYVLCIQ